MKKIIITILFILPLFPSLGISFFNEDPDFIIESEKKIEDMEIENNRLFALDRVSNIGKMIKNAENTLTIAFEVRSRCESFPPGDDYVTQCYNYARIFSETSARMKLNVARYCIFYGLMDTAKKLYRNIITTYESDSFKPFVEQARFGLEELK